MRLLLSLSLAVASVFVAHASTITDNFTYTYVLSGDTYVTTFSLVDGQAVSVPVDYTTGAYIYQGVALNGNAASSATVSISPATTYFNGRLYFTDGFSFRLFNEAMPDVIDLGIASGLILQDGSATSLTFAPGVYGFYQGGVQVGGKPLAFDRSSLAISQTVTQDPTPVPVPAPVAVTPEPGTLSLLGTGLLAVGAAARRRLFA